MASLTQIGLDIGSTSIRAVETSRTKDGPVVNNTERAPLPPGAVQGGVVANDQAVTVALRQMWTSTRFGGNQVVLGVSNPQLVVREMTLSNLPEREMRKSLPFQVRDLLPLPVDKSILDFCPLEDPGAGSQVRGLLIAAPKDAVLTAVHAVERAGLQVSKVDLASFALLRSSSRLDNTVEAIVDIGAQATTVIVHADGAPLIVRTIPRGGAEITETIAKRLSVSVAEAEELKCHLGLLPEPPAAQRRGGQHAARRSRSGADDGDAEAREAIRDAVGPLISEIRSSFVYLSSGERHVDVTRLALAGGGAQLPGLVDALSAQLDIDVVLADPTVRLRGAPDADWLRSSAAVSIGLTLGASQ